METGTFYFVCNVRGGIHAKQGHKIKIIVEE